MYCIIRNFPKIIKYVVYAFAKDLKNIRNNDIYEKLTESFVN